MKFWSHFWISIQYKYCFSSRIATHYELASSIDCSYLYIYIFLETCFNAYGSLICRRNVIGCTCKAVYPYCRKTCGRCNRCDNSPNKCSSTYKSPAYTWYIWYINCPTRKSCRRSNRTKRRLAVDCFVTKKWLTLLRCNTINTNMGNFIISIFSLFWCISFHIIILYFYIVLFLYLFLYFAF